MRNSVDVSGPPVEAPWADLLPPEQWAVYEPVIAEARKRGIPFVLGGGLAFSHYADRWRNTKDLDLYVAPDRHQDLIDVVLSAGLIDLHDTAPYDRGWIFRSHNQNGVIIDIIWQMANYRAQVDDAWLTRGDEIRIRGTTLRLLPPEELMWAKLYILQRDRCDWGDLLNILYTRAATLDWPHFLKRVGDDKPILAALLEVFSWACPEKAWELVPADVWKQLGIIPSHIGPTAPEVDRSHIRLLDSRDWFGPNQPHPDHPTHPEEHKVAP